MAPCCFIIKLLFAAMASYTPSSARINHHPFLGGGVYDPRQEASYEGAVECLTITLPIKPLGRAAPATSSTRCPYRRPRGTPRTATVHFRAQFGAMGTVGPEPEFEASAFIIRS